nr:eukaryotic translation initiation factor 4E1-like [Procambarus clarkii]
MPKQVSLVSRGPKQTEQQRQCEEEEHKCHYVALESLLVKHPLKNTWTMWYYKVKSSNVWMECHTEIASFNTVEDFWAVYHHLNLPSEIERGSGYSMFRKGIKPMWEDSHNWNGGRWLFTIQESNECQKLDDIWMEMQIDEERDFVVRILQPLKVAQQEGAAVKKKPTKH